MYFAFKKTFGNLKSLFVKLLIALQFVTLILTTSFPSSVLALPAYKSDPSNQNGFCKYGAPTRVPTILNGRKFALPIELEPVLRGPRGNIILNPQLFCVDLQATKRPDMLPYEIEHFVIYNQAFKTNYKKYGVLPIQLMVDRARTTYGTLKGHFCSVKQELQADDTTWSTYEGDTNFQKVVKHPTSAKNYSKSYLYSDKYKLFGQPVIVECINLDSRKARKSNDDCTFSQQLDDNTRMRLFFGWQYVSNDKLGELFKGLEAFLKDISADSIPTTTDTDCDTLNNKE